MWAYRPLPPPPKKKIRVQKSAGKVLASIFFGSRRHPPHWLSSKGPNHQRGVLLISAGATEGHFEGKTPREDHQGGLVLARQCLGSPGTCNPEETGLPLLITHPILRIWPHRTTTYSLDWINNWKVGGHCCRGDLVGRTTFWFFLSSLQKLEQRAKKWGVSWINPEFVRCSLFPSWSG